MTVHPRTKKQTYDGRADWSLVARARELLSIPVVRAKMDPFLLLNHLAIYVPNKQF